MKENRFGVPKANLLGGGKKFSAKDNFPDLSKHNNVMASHLTYEVSVAEKWSRLWCDSVESWCFSHFVFFF